MRKYVISRSSLQEVPLHRRSSSLPPQLQELFLQDASLHLLQASLLQDSQPYDEQAP